MKVYLAGHVPKSLQEEADFDYWRMRYAEVIRQKLGAECIDPSSRDLDESDCKQVFGHDCRQIRDCAMLVVNAENRVGPGTGMEMVIAKYFKKPVVTVLPKNSVHRKSSHTFKNQTIDDWRHAFIDSMSDLIIEDISEIRLVNDPKGIEIIDEAIASLN